MTSMTSCGASFRMIANEQDSLMAPYGIPNSVDTVDVCESWTGADYQYQATAIGSSDEDPVLVDSVQTTTYQNGLVTGYTPAGNPAAPASSVGATAFDFLFADNSTRQASYDYPYYGVSSPDPAACLQPPCPLASRAINPPAVNITTPSMNTALPPFTRHGLTRVGIRALVDNSEELTPSPEGFRRFRTVFRGETITRSIDPRTQLLVAEETSSSTDTMKVVHTWIAVPGGFVRDHSDFVTVELIDGKTLRSRSTISFQKVSVTDPAYALIKGPDLAR
jgi:hypothetical protein